MSFERIQPRTEVNPFWDKETPVVPKKETAGVPAKNNQPKTTGKGALEAAGKQNQAAAVAATNKQGKVSQSEPAQSPLQTASEKIQALVAQNQLNQQISAVGQEMAVTQQEMDQADRDQGNVVSGSSGSYWNKLSVSEKARTINQLKEKLENLDLEQSQLQSRLTEEINSGKYQASGTDIVKGMLQAE
jgi:predicted RNase H-like nuclease (RuvC/YqgF family)